jgi:thermitase
MKIFLSILLFSVSGFCAEFDGYIIKMKSNKSVFKIKKEILEDSKIRNFSFGSYLTWKPKTGNNKSLDDLRNNPDILYIEPNYLLKEIGTTKEGPEVIADEFFARQWSLENTGKNTQGTIFGGPVPGVDIKAKEAWKITKGSSEIVIAVLDGGVFFTHPDLVDNMWKNEKELNGVPGFDDDGNGYIDDIHGFTPPGNKNQNPSDITGHGTHIAGTIAMAHNSIGGRGVMAKVKIMPAKMKDDKTFAYPMENVLMSIDYAIKMGANIITTSVGGDPYSKSFEDAIRMAGSKGIPFVCACGNSNDNLDKKKIYPPSYAQTLDNMIVVCNHGPGGKKDYLSSYGNKTVQIFAPGEDIYSTSVSVMDNSQGVRDPIYKRMDGSSMSAPHVAGAIGLLLSIEPNLTPKEIRDRIVRTAKKEEKLKKYAISGGRLDLQRLLLNIEN